MIRKRIRRVEENNRPRLEGPIKIENIDETLALVSDIISGALEPVTSKYDSDSIARARVFVQMMNLNLNQYPNQNPNQNVNKI